MSQIVDSSIVFFDADCPMCERLAQFAETRTRDARFISWQAFQSSDEAKSTLPDDVRARPADRLRVWSNGRLLEGPDAWAFLLERNRDLSGLGWLASKLGLTNSAARSVERAGSIVRRMCLRCPRR